jgi:hypothetical protein
MTRTVDVFSDRQLVEMLAEQPELLAICDAIAETRPVPRRRQFRATTLLLAAAVALVALVAPAFALTRVAIQFFSSPAAPAVAIVNFAELSTGAPAGMDPRAIAGEARAVARQRLADGNVLTLSVAPTATGGFCYLVSSRSDALAGGCDARREIPFASGLAAASYPQGSAILSGSVLNPDAATAGISMANGSHIELAIVHVSSPINASFYFGEARISRASFPLTTTIRDDDGEVVASRTIPAPPGP